MGWLGATMRRIVVIAPRSVGVLVAVAALGLACGQAPRRDAPAQTLREDLPAPVEILAQKPMFSQKNEELIIRDFFQDRRNGFFLDVGCWSPLTKNNTYYLEKYLDWTGIGIDALPEYGPAWREKRPRSRFFNYLVSDHSGTVETFFRSELPSVSSADKDRVAVFQGQELEFEELEVPTITLTELLEQNEVSAIDLMSMDIEGGEILALAGFDIDRFRPALVCIEASPPNREKIREYFETHGYTRIEKYLEYDQTNYYYAPRSDAP